MAEEYRIERDTMGEVRVPAHAKWRAQTQRAVENFPISGVPVNVAVIHALATVKGIAAGVNADLGVVDSDVAKAVQDAAVEVARGDHDDQFPIDVFQTGSGTSHEHERQRGARHPRQRAPRPPGAPQRLGQREPVEQRHLPDRDPCRRHPRRRPRPRPGARPPRRRPRAQGDRVRRRGQVRPHAPHGRHAGHARAGVRRVRGPGPLRHRAPRGDPPPPRRAPPRRHRGRHRHQHPARLRRARRRRARR